MGSSNSSFPKKSCACAYNAFLAGIISWSVGSIIYNVAVEDTILFPAVLNTDAVVKCSCVVKEISLCNLCYSLFYVLVNVVSVLTAWNI